MPQFNDNFKKSVPCLVFCSNNFIINPDFVVRLQVTILNRNSLPVCNISDSFMEYSEFVLCAVFFLSQCHCHPVRHVHQAFFVLMINEANILLWHTVVTLNWSTTATMRCSSGVRQLTRAIVWTIACCARCIVMIVMIVVRPWPRVCRVYC